MISLFTDAQIETIAAQAKAALPGAINGRLEKAVRLVRSGSVELHADGSAVVISESDGLTGYLIANGRCTCPDFQFQPPEVEGWCCHKIARALVLRLQRHAVTPSNGTQEPHTDAKEAGKEKNGSMETSQDSDATLPVVEGKNGVSAPDGMADLLKPFLVYIKQKPFIRYAGLLKAAHAQGLCKLETTFISVTEAMALAQCTATFADGRVFTDVADSSPSNVGAQVKAHWPRLSATRAAARALRNALGIDACSVEELGEVVDG
jgi:hypothetical protein